MVDLKCLGQKNTEMGLYCHAEIKQLQEDFEINNSRIDELDKEVLLLHDELGQEKDYESIISEKDNLIKSAIDGLEECDATICRLCRVINPQHKDCTQCDDRDYLLEIISKAKGAHNAKSK